MDKEWSGKAVSIECRGKLGIFQGIISQCTASEISIVRAFRNGIPLKKQNSEITLPSQDIVKISLLPTSNQNQNLVHNQNQNQDQSHHQNHNQNHSHNYNRNNNNRNKNVNNVSKSAERHQVNRRMGIDAFGNAFPDYENNGGDGAARGTLTGNRNYRDDGQVMGHGNLTKRSSSAILANECRTPKTADYNRTNSVTQFFGNMIPPKVEVMFGGGIGVNSRPISTGNKKASTNDFYMQTGSNHNHKNNIPKSLSGEKSSSMSNVEGNLSANNSGNQKRGSVSNGNFNSNSNLNANMNQNAYSNGNGNGNGNGNENNSSGNGNVRNKQRKQKTRRDNTSNITFATSINDPSLYEDFDFEGNLALFDKRAIWDKIDSSKKPDLVQHTVTTRKKKTYRHDENVLDSGPVQMRQITSLFAGSADFVTDEGLIIPTIPMIVRSKIESNAQKCGLSLQRQLDILARGTTDLAMLLLGGARRFIPNNRHQWPVITIICEKSYDFRASNVGAATGRHLASHGLKVVLYIDEDSNIEQTSIEILLFKATGNLVVYSVNEFPSSDLVILSSNSAHIPNDIVKWLNKNRASVLAIDPPPGGIIDISIQYSILPILPLNGISSSNCGKLYLCNLGVPEKFYCDAGVKYKSPFGHKFVIPLHTKD